MRDHLNQKHTEVLLNLPISQNWNSKEENLHHSNQNSQQNITKYNENSSRKKMLDNLFAKMIALDMEPLRLNAHQSIRCNVRLTLRNTQNVKCHYNTYEDIHENESTIDSIISLNL